jgi:hypothetical protein
VDSGVGGADVGAYSFTLSGGGVDPEDPTGTVNATTTTAGTVTVQ